MAKGLHDVHGLLTFSTLLDLSAPLERVHQVTEARIDASST
jgi:hypothetical protein